MRNQPNSEETFLSKTQSELPVKWAKPQVVIIPLSQALTGPGGALGDGADFTSTGPAS